MNDRSLSDDACADAGACTTGRCSGAKERLLLTRGCAANDGELKRDAGELKRDVFAVFANDAACICPIEAAPDMAAERGAMLAPFIPGAWAFVAMAFWR